MGSEDLEAIRRMYEAFNRGELEEGLELHAPGVEWNIGSGVYRGKDEARGWLEDVRDGFADIRFEVERLIDLGERVLVLVRVYGRGLQSGAIVDQRPAHLFELRDGQVVRLTSYGDRHKALAAAGIRD